MVKVLSETVDGDEDLLDSVTANIDEDVLRAYLAECRELTPVFANDAVKEALRTWYVETKTQLIRREREEDRVIPLTPRTQQDVIRLAVASAKARHSEEIEMVDAERATRLKSRSFRELGLSEEIGVDVTADADGVETGRPRSSRSSSNRSISRARRTARTLMRSRQRSPRESTRWASAARLISSRTW